MYNPAMGIWTIRDPVQEGLNLYQNVMSNPANLIDPLGLMTLYDTPDKIRKKLGVKVEKDDSLGEGTVSTSTIRNTIRVGSAVEGARRDAQVDYHETIGIIGRQFNGIGDGDSRGVAPGVKGSFPPPWKESEAEQNGNPDDKGWGYKEKEGTRTGWHNLSLMGELAAYAQKALPTDKPSPAAYGRGRWSSIPTQPYEGADVSRPGKPPVPWQEDLRKMIRWMCDCETKGTAEPYRYTYDTNDDKDLRKDNMRLRLEIVLECVNRSVQTKTLKMEYYS